MVYIEISESRFSLGSLYKSNHRKCCIKNVFSKVSKNSQETTCARVSFLIKLQHKVTKYILKDTMTQFFSSEFYEILKNTFPTEHIQTTAFDYMEECIHKYVESCNSKFQVIHIERVFKKQLKLKPVQLNLHYWIWSQFYHMTPLAERVVHQIYLHKINLKCYLKVKRSLLIHMYLVNLPLLEFYKQFLVVFKR